MYKLKRHSPKPKNIEAVTKMVPKSPNLTETLFRFKLKNYQDSSLTNLPENQEFKGQKKIFTKKMKGRDAQSLEKEDTQKLLKEALQETRK